jgi:hypothetical protein
METCLIVCWDPTGIAALHRCRSTRPFVVASDDPRVQESARRMPGVAQVTYIERDESFWTVASDVKAVIARVDEWLGSLDRSLPQEMLAWAGSVEGGLTGQRVQDALLLIRSYQHLFRSFDVREVQAIVDPRAAWEADVLQVCARAMSLPVARHNTGILGAWKTRAWRFLMPLAKAAYLLMREVMLGAARSAGQRADAGLDAAIVFQVCSSLQKHVDNAKYLMVALVSRGERAVGLCWGAGDWSGGPSGVDQLRAAGLSAVGLERFVSARDVLGSLWRAAVTFARGRRRRRLLDSLEYEGVPLAPLLAESIRHFMIAVLPARLRYARAFEACLGRARPAAIKPWGGGDSFEGKLALRLTHAASGSMYIHYWVGAGMPGWPYTDPAYSPEVFLAKSASEAPLAKAEYGLDDPQVHVVGQARWAHLSGFDTLHAVVASRRHLALPPDGTLYVGLDTGAAVRGFQSRREQVDQLVTVLNAAREAPGMVVAIKAHPGHAIDHLLPFIESHKSKNIVVLPRAASVEHFLNAVDVVVTKYSTLILEAALLGRCPIAAILDGETRFTPFGELPAVVTSSGELHTLLTGLASDRDALDLWTTAERLRHTALLPYFYHQASTPAPDLAAEAIIQHLELRGR